MLRASTVAGTGAGLHRGSPLPLYEQLKRALVGMIETGLLRTGDQVPATSELCSRFGVSHITVTKALDGLVRDGVVTRIQGKGTFVTAQRIERRLTNLISFTHEMGRQGLTVSSRVLHTEVVPHNSQLNRAFHRSPDAPEQYIRIRRLRLLNGGAACLATSLFPEAVGRRLLELPLENSSFYELLERRLGLRLLREEQWITPVLADREVARLLDVRPGAPLFRMEGMTYLEGDVPIEATDSLFRGDKFRFFANVYRFVGDEHEAGAAGAPPVEPNGRRGNDG